MITPRHVAVLIARTDGVLQLAARSALAGVLDAVDHERVARLRFEPDRRTASASRLLQRLAVAWAAGGGVELAAALQFDASAGGKPRVDAPWSARVVTFSVSNTRGMVGCAVAAGAPIGLDLEAGSAELSDDLLEHCLHPLERTAFDALPSAQRSARFMTLWTLKEAYLKARGSGLDRAPAAIAFEAEGADGEARLLHDPAEGARPPRWAVRRLDLGPECAGALCTPIDWRVSVHWLDAEIGLAALPPSAQLGSVLSPADPVRGVRTPPAFRSQTPERPAR